jgi:hypothetical protein
MSSSDADRYKALLLMSLVWDVIERSLVNDERHEAIVSEPDCDLAFKEEDPDSVKPTSCFPCTLPSLDSKTFSISGWTSDFEAGWTGIFRSRRFIITATTTKITRDMTETAHTTKPPSITFSVDDRTVIGGVSDILLFMVASIIIDATSDKIPKVAVAPASR